MATSKELVWTCDNPDCGHKTLSEDGGKSYPQGWHFEQVFRVMPMGGGPMRKVYACSDRCITPALLFRWQEDAK